jgi:hypothetical protein
MVVLCFHHVLCSCKIQDFILLAKDISSEAKKS